MQYTCLGEPWHLHFSFESAQFLERFDNVLLPWECPGKLTSIPNFNVVLRPTFPPKPRSVCIAEGLRMLPAVFCTTLCSQLWRTRRLCLASTCHATHVRFSVGDFPYHDLLRNNVKDHALNLNTATAYCHSCHCHALW